MSFRLENAYVIGSENFNNWSRNYESVGYLKVLPHPDLKVPFQDPFADWQAGREGNYISSWGADTGLTFTLKMQDLNQIEIDGLGILKSGDGVIPWLNNERTPYEQLRAYNGTIPGTLIITEPGDTLNINIENNLTDSSQISNLHTHGLHVSPMGYGDNVLNTIETGESWPAVITIPDNHNVGLDWYHPHLHGLTNEQVSSGLAGQLVILPPYDIPDLNKFNPKTEPFHFMALNTFGIQQVDRVGSPNDPLNQNLDISVPAGTPLKVENTEAGDSVYSLSDAPFMGYNAKPLGFNPKQPAGDPSQNLPVYGSGPLVEPVENAIYTINGQYNPTMDITTGAWNLFGLTNMSTNTFHLINLVKQVGDQLIPQTVDMVALDGNSSGAAAPRSVTTLPVFSPGQRLAFQEWFDEPGTYYLLSNGTEEILGDNTPTLVKGHKGFSDGHLIWGPQVLATINVTGDPKPVEAPPQPYDVIIQSAQKLDDLLDAAQNGQIDRERKFVWSANIGGAIVAGNIPSDTDAASFEGTYSINGNFFAQNFTDSMVPLTMPMLGSTEVWNMVNSSGASNPNSTGPDIPLLEWHPFHIHQNDFTILSINGIPASDIKNSFLNDVSQDTVPLPPTYDPDKPPTPENPYGTPLLNGTPSETKVLMKFEDFPGTFVNHCHILFHEDAGMMAPVRVILNTKDTWLGSDSSGGSVLLQRANNPSQKVNLFPYAQSYQGGVSVAIGDINYKTKPPEDQNVTDNVTDVAVVQSSPQNGRLSVKVFDGETLIEEQEAGLRVINGEDNHLLLNEFTPFADTLLTSNTKAEITTGDINGDGYSDVIVGISGDRNPVVEIYSGKDYQLLARLNPLSSHSSFTGAITLASGDVNGDNFDDILIGGYGSVELYSGLAIDREGSLNGTVTAQNSEIIDHHLHPYGISYKGSIDVTSGYILQRPDVPNDAATQTYRANITTLATGDLPDGQQSVKVFTYAGGHHEMSEHDHETATNSSESADIRLDAEFTPSSAFTSISGTFADLPGLPNGEPILYGLSSSNSAELIHLGAMNAPSKFYF
jgi:FtsP/CotA-like multicopper oxidase with cupredoxin domain